MATSNASLLIVDDDPAVLRAISKYFESRFEVFRAMTAKEAADIYEGHQPDVAILDLDLPDLSGLHLLGILCNKGATAIMLTGHGDIPTAVEAVQAGAENFLTKPVDLGHLEAIVDRALEKARFKRIQRYQQDANGAHSLDGLGSSPPMRQLAAEIERVAVADRTTVLLRGESGTGKGWVAEKIHALSPRGDAVLVDINCATLTGTFLESELFGHEKGAFTDAKQLKRGLFEIADRGTLFLDEIGDLDITLQPKLLKVLESRTFRRIGGTREIEVDVRLIAASNHDLERAVSEGDFREDLLYRLNVMPLKIPPLRKRSRDDVAQLALRVLEDLKEEFPRGPKRVSPEALQLIAGYGWPGNVRELRNVLERARILAGDVESLEPSHLPEELRASPSSTSQARGGEIPTLEELERRHIEQVLRLREGNRTQAAEELGIARGTLHNKIKKYGLEEVGL